MMTRLPLLVLLLGLGFGYKRHPEDYPVHNVASLASLGPNVTARNIS